MADTAKTKHTHNEREKTCSGLEVTQYNAIRRQFNAHIMQKCKMKSEKEKSPVQDAIFQKGM